MTLWGKRSSRRHSEPRFVIWAPSYDETSGGVMALHTLCDRLNQMGVKASLCPPHRADLPNSSLIRKIGRFIISRRRDRKYRTGPFNNKIARRRYLAHSIIVYPEIVSGNPLKADMVVRWFLYHPGKHTGETTFGKDDLFFFYMPAFNDLAINPNGDNLLRVSTLIPAYCQTNHGLRSGSCVLVYKGKGRTLDQHPSDAIPVDGISHEQRADIFNRTKYLYSYDLYSFYNVYAAMCGCIPIVIPEAGLSRDQWCKEKDRRFGLAYGGSDIAWAEETQPALLERLKQDRAEEDRMVKDFVQKCMDKFGHD